MLWVNSENKIPIKSWCATLDEKATKQAKNLANHPTVYHHVALMPDSHAGSGMPIGGVIACDKAVIPNAVGVDIGCGMAAVKTSYTDDITKEQVKRVFTIMKRNVPVGFDHHAEKQVWDGFDEAPDTPPVVDNLDGARYQLGTLGGGNHFIELQRGDDGHIWLMLHSGSRNFGYRIAKYYNEVARSLCTQYHSEGGPYIKEDGLAFIPADTDEGVGYVASMYFALKFAAENRKRIMWRFQEAASTLKCDFVQEINIHHNFASLENHFGKNVWVHRKGATQARKGQWGIIPGSMGTSSYIVKGLGNPDSFESCSHGAGRVMGRMAFNRTTTIEECDKAMDGVVFDGWGKDRKGNPDFSEAPAAYKDIDAVIAAEKDLVEVVVKLTPLGVMKG